MSRSRVVDYATGPFVWPVRPDAPVVGQEVVWLDRQGPVIACAPEEDMARQEYALQSSLSYQVQRFGVGNFAQGKSGAVDFDHMDLTRAHELIAASQEAWLRLPAVIRNRYQSWANVEAAAASGELEQLLKAAGAEGVSLPSAAAAAPSDSAAEGAPKAV